MSVAITSIVKNTDGSWTFNWPGSGSFRVVLWGIQFAVGNITSYTWSTTTEYKTFPPPIEVVPNDGITLALSEQYLPYLIMQWYGERPVVSCYLVQQYNGTSWNTIQTINETGQWLYSFQTAILTDETTYQYRVIAVDRLGNQSTPRTYTRYVVCPPAPVDNVISIGYTKPNIVIASH